MFKLFPLPTPVWEEPGSEGPTPPPVDPAASALSASPDPAADASALSASEGAAPPATPPVESPAEALSAESITLPEGVELSEGALDGFLEIMNDAELPRGELAQKLIDLQLTAATAATEASNEAAQTAWNETQAQWQQEMNALPQIGGAKLDESLASIKKGLIQIGATKETFAALDLTGAGNHPEIIRILYALTKPLAESGPVSGDPPTGKLSLADKLYGNQT